jgi:hypothetical protein
MITPRPDGNSRCRASTQTPARQARPSTTSRRRSTRRPQRPPWSIALDLDRSLGHCRGQHLLPGLRVAGVNQHGHDDQLRHRHGGVIVSGRWSVYPVAVQGPRSVHGEISGRGLQSGEPLLRAAEAKSVRIRDGKMQVTGGPPSNAQPGSQQPAPGRPLGALFSGPFSLTRCNASSPTTSPPRSPRRRPNSYDPSGPMRPIRDRRSEARHA